MPRVATGSRREILILALIVLSLLLAGFDRRGRMADAVRSQAAHVFAPTQSWLKDFTLTLVGGPSTRRPHGGTPEAEIRRLREALADADRDLVDQAAIIDNLKKELRDVKGLVNDFDSPEYPLALVSANVLSRQYILPHNNLRIDVGSRQNVGGGHWVVHEFINRGETSGVRSGQPVVTGRGMVGVVDEVSSDFSQVRLVTSEKCVLPARVMHWDAESGHWVPQTETGHVQGSGDGKTMRLTMMPRSVNVAPGDYVVTAGGETGLPEYAIIGQVTDVSYLPTELSYRVLLRPRVDLDALDRVYVLSPRGQAAP